MSRYQVNQKQPGSSPVRVVFFLLHILLLHFWSGSVVGYDVPSIAIIHARAIPVFTSEVCIYTTSFALVNRGTHGPA